MSILTLAAAANNCYHGMGKPDTPTLTERSKKSLKKKDYDLAVKVENFAKHANTDAKAEVRLTTEYGELLILDSVMCQAQLFDKWTPLMICFYTRFSLENATLISRFAPLETREYFHKAVEVDQLGDRSRIDYLKDVLPTLIAKCERESYDETPPI